MRVHFEGRTLTAAEGESVLECLERQGVALPSFCRNGACQTCMVKAEGGQVPAAAQAGVKESWRRQGYFLACMCRNAGELQVSRCDAARAFDSRVIAVERLPGNVLRVQLAKPAGFEFAAGQFVQLERPADALMRPYSIASLPDDAHLELHVALLPEGRMSQWLTGAVGEAVTLRGPFGDCSYWPDEPERPLLLAGTGTGLAPLLGVLRAALAAGHRAPIRLFHGASRREGLYLWDALQALAARHAHLQLQGSALDAGAPAGDADAGPVTAAPLAQQVLALGDAVLASQRVYLCGGPSFVQELRREVYLSGVPLSRIHADPFLAPAKV